MLSVLCKPLAPSSLANQGEKNYKRRGTGSIVGADATRQAFHNDVAADLYLGRLAAADICLPADAGLLALRSVVDSERFSGRSNNRLVLQQSVCRQEFRRGKVSFVQSPDWRMVDPQRAHIWYEECTSCRGSFFDAGEFSDLTDDDVADFLKLVAMSKNQYWCVAGVPAGTLRSVVVRAKLQLIQTNQSPAYWCCEDFCNVSTIRARFTRQCSINRYSLTGH